MRLNVFRRSTIPQKQFIIIIYCGRSVALIYFYSSFIYSRVTHEINTRRNFWTREIPTRKNFEPTKYPREKISDPQIPTMKNLGPTKYSRENILGPQNTHQKNIWTDEGMMHDGTMVRDPQNSANSNKTMSFMPKLKRSGPSLEP